MGLFSNLFKKNEKETKINVVFEPVTSPSTHEVDIPEFQGDYAKTIFLWAHSKASSVKPKDGYARYFLYECGIRDTSAYHKGLISQGFFEKASVKEMLESLTVAELKKILADLNKTQTGKKKHY